MAPLSSLRVLEFSGLAPGPMVGLVLADFGADVVRIDKVNAGLNADTLCRGKRSVALDPKKPRGLRAIRLLASKADVIIDPFRPGVLERLGVGPEDVRVGRDGIEGNERVVFARLTGFQREGPYANMAGHDINYIALSGLLSMLGSAGGAPAPPSNILGDFAGGSFICLLGILMALLERVNSGKGQVVEADMVTGARYVSTFLLLGSHLSHPEWGSIIGDGSEESRGAGALAGGAPWYGVYKCKDGKWFSVGAIEPPFYKEFLSILKRDAPNTSVSQPSPKTQNDRATWPELKAYLTEAFLQRTRSEWELSFVGTDACAVPVLTRDEAGRSVLPRSEASSRTTLASSEGQDEEDEADIVVPQPAPRLGRTPALTPAGSSADPGAPDLMLNPGEHTLEVLSDAKWAGLKDDELVKLWKDSAASGADEPEGVERSKL